MFNFYRFLVIFLFSTAVYASPNLIPTVKVLKISGHDPRMPFSYDSSERYLHSDTVCAAGLYAARQAYNTSFSPTHRRSFEVEGYFIGIYSSYTNTINRDSNPTNKNYLSCGYYGTETDYNERGEVVGNPTQYDRGWIHITTTTGCPDLSEPVLDSNNKKMCVLPPPPEPEQCEVGESGLFEFHYCTANSADGCIPGTQKTRPSSFCSNSCLHIPDFGSGTDASCYSYINSDGSSGPAVMCSVTALTNGGKCSGEYTAPTPDNSCPSGTVAGELNGSRVCVPSPDPIPDPDPDPSGGGGDGSGDGGDGSGHGGDGSGNGGDGSGNGGDGSGNGGDGSGNGGDGSGNGGDGSGNGGDGSGNGGDGSGNGGDGSGNGDEGEREDEESESEVSGGQSCDSPPVCTGDAVQCAILAQQFKIRCDAEDLNDYEKHKGKVESLITGQQFELKEASIIEVPNFITGHTRWLPSSCPPDETMSLRTNGGRTFSLSYQPLCNAASTISPLIIIIATLMATLYVGRAAGGS